MRLYLKYILISLIFFIFIFSTPVIADHSTCQSENGAESSNCSEVVDWSEIFSNVEMYDGGNLMDSNYLEYQHLYTQIRLGLNDNKYSNLQQNNFYAHESYTTTDDLSLEENQESKTLEFTRDIDQSNTRPTNDDFIPNYLFADLHLPPNTYIDITVYNRDDEIFYEETFESGSFNIEDDSYSSRRLNIAEDINIDNSYTNYIVEVELNRDTTEDISVEEIDSPKIKNGVVLERMLPLYRLESLGQTDYPIEMMSNINKQMYENYNSQYSTSDSEIYSPMYNEELYTDLVVEDGHYEGGLLDISDEGRPIRQSYVNISHIEPSIKSPSESNINNEWDYIIGSEGELYINYDAAVDEIPPDGQDYTGDVSSGDRRWSYTQNTPLEYDITVTFNTDTGSYIIDTEEKTTGGIHKVEYTDEDYSGDIQSISTNVDYEFTVLRQEDLAETYEVETENGTETRCCRWNNNFDSEIITYETTNFDTVDIDNTGDNDGPTDDNFNIEVAMLSDENRVYVDRVLQDNNVDDMNLIDNTRWSNIHSNSTVNRNQHQINLESYTGQSSVDFSSIGEYLHFKEYKEEFNIDDVEIYLDMWYHGDISDGTLQTRVNDNLISEIEAETEKIEDVQKVINNEEITNKVENDRIIINNQIINHNNDFEHSPYISYTITVVYDETIYSATSRWQNMPFRNSQFDNITEIEPNCTEGFLNDFNLRDCFDIENNQIEPTGTHPLQMHLLPTADSLERNLSNNPIPTNVENVVKDYKTTLNLPIESKYCPIHTEYDNKNICSVYNGFIADGELEQSYINDEIEYDEPDNNDEYPSSIRTEPTISALYGENNVLDYRALIEDDTNRVPVASSFEIVTDEHYDNFKISGNASWNSNPVTTDEVKIGTETNIDLSYVSTEKLTEDYINNIEDNIHESNDIEQKEDLEYYLQRQVKITLEDSFGNPINTQERPDDEYIRIAAKSPQNDGYVGNYSVDVQTNESGVAYTTIPDIDSETFESVVVMYNTTNQWTELDDRTRLLESSIQANMIQAEDVYFREEEETNTIERSIFYNYIMGIVLIMVSTFFIMSKVARTYPNSHMTTMDLINTSISPFKNKLKSGIQLMFVILLLTFIMYLIVIGL